MRVYEHFLYEYRSKGIIKADWAKIRAAADKMRELVDPTSGIPGTSFAIGEVRNDTDNLSYQLGSEFVSINRIWKKKHYEAPEIPKTYHFEPVCDLFLRGVFLAIAFYTPKSVGHEIRSTGSLSGWVEAQKLFEAATGELQDVHLMAATERLCKGFDTPLPVDGDFHLTDLAATLVGEQEGGDATKPMTAAAKGDSTPIRDIPISGQSWFF